VQQQLKATAGQAANSVERTVSAVMMLIADRGGSLMLHL
jgi:hypothetical protein